MSEQHPASVLTLTANIVSAHVSSNHVPFDTLPLLIQSVYQSLITARHLPVDEAVASKVPAVSIKKSVFPDYIICLEDGKKLKMLKRHLQSSFGMTPDDYRARWNLPRDYPMVAPSYAAIRSELARKVGLGRKLGNGPEVSGKSSSEAKVTPVPARRARGSKA